MNINTHTGKVLTNKLSEDLENWMTNLPQKLRSTPIIYLAIPGSHDSFTSNISAKSDMSPDADSILQTFKFLGPIFNYFIANWSRTQSYMATDQLKSGIRYFDLRIATKENTEELFFVHALYSVDVQSVFNDILAFLETHPQEVVILDCQHFYAFTQTDHERLMQMFGRTFGAKLLPYSDHMDYITLEYMTTQYRYQVIVIYRSDAARFGQPLLWPSNSFPTPWPDTVSIPDLVSALDEGLEKRSLAVGYVSQCVLTPSATYILQNLCSTLKKKCAMDFEAAKLEWINRQKSGEGGMNIVISDYIDLSDCQYVKSVINLNEQLITPPKSPPESPLKSYDSVIVVNEKK